MENQLNTTALYIGVIIYFACMIMVGFLVRKKASTAEGYLVAGRSFGLLFNSAALTACFLGGSIILALPGLSMAWAFGTMARCGALPVLWVVFSACSWPACSTCRSSGG